MEIGLLSIPGKDSCSYLTNYRNHSSRKSWFSYEISLCPCECIEMEMNLEKYVNL